MSIFGLIFFLLFIFIIVPVLVTLVRAAFFVHRARKSVRDAFRGMDNGDGGSGQQDCTARHRRSKKIDPRDGEYVAYEEIAVSASETADNGRHSMRYTVEQQIVDAEWEDIPDSK